MLSAARGLARASLAALVVLLLGIPAVAGAQGTLPKEYSYVTDQTVQVDPFAPSGSPTESVKRIHYSDGTTQDFRPLQFGKLRDKTLHRARTFRTNAPGAGAPTIPASSYVDVRSKLATSRRGWMGLAGRMGIAKPWQALGLVGGLVEANVVVWQHNAGYIRDALGKSGGNPPLQGYTSYDLQPVRPGTSIWQVRCEEVLGALPAACESGFSTVRTAGFGYRLTATVPQAGGGSFTTAQDSEQRQHGVSPDSKMNQIVTGLPTYSGWMPWTWGGNGWSFDMRQAPLFQPGDPQPFQGTAAAGNEAGGAKIVNEEANQPSTKTAAEEEAAVDAALSDQTLNADERKAITDDLVDSGAVDRDGNTSTATPRIVYRPELLNGQSGAAAVALLEAAGFTNVSKLVASFDDALTDHAAEQVLSARFDGANVTLPTAPNVREFTLPATAPIVVTQNPADPGMPRQVPAPQTGDDYLTYRQRLIDRGLATTPSSAPFATEPELNPNPAKGPGEVTRTDPAPGSKVARGTTVKVTVNPGNAPAPGGGGGAFTPPAIPAFDLSPLGAAQLCENFPFGVPCWVNELVGNFVGSPVTPSWAFHFPMAGPGANTVVELGMFEPHMPKVRAIVGVVIAASMVWLFYGLAFGGGVPARREDG